MGYRVIRVKNPSQLPLAVKTVGSALEKATVKALQRTARFGHTAVVRTMAKTTPKPEATQTYRQAWTVQKTRHGAILGNSALASYFVEVGRKPGRMPPYSNPADGILRWVIAKRFKFGDDGRIVKRKPRRTGRKRKARTPAEKKIAAEKGKGGAKGSVGGGSKRRKSGKAARAQRKLQERFAFLVARKIAIKGTPGRYVLARTMPQIQKRAFKETRRALAMVSQRRGKL